MFIVPVKSMNDKLPFFLALKAIDEPSYFILALRSPLLDRSSTLKLLHSPRATQNYLVKALFNPTILLSFKISILALILSIL